MKTFAILLAALLFLSSLARPQTFGFLRASNSAGDYWIYISDGITLVVIYDEDARTLKITDRRAAVSDLAVAKTTIFRGEGGNLASFRLTCKQAGCVSSDFVSGKFNAIDVFCNQDEDCQTFLDQLQQ